MRLSAVVILVVTLLVRGGVASERLRDSNQAWQAWLLLDSEAAPPQGDAPRRITPKSVFITPSFTPQQLPACADGYRADALGRCVRIVRVDHAAHINFLLRQLNAAYALPTTKPPAENSQPEQQQSGPSGPLQVSLPITNVPQAGAGANYENDGESSPDVVLNIWELGASNDTLPKADKQSVNGPKGEVNVVNSLPMLILSHKFSSQGNNDESTEMTEIPGANESEHMEALYPNESKKQVYYSETNNSTNADTSDISNGTVISEPGTRETSADVGESVPITFQPAKVESIDDAKQTSSTVSDNIVFTISTSIPQQENHREYNVETYSTRTLAGNQESDKIVFTDSSNESSVNYTHPENPKVETPAEQESEVISVKNASENHPFSTENDDVVQSAKRLLPENPVIRIRNEAESLIGDGTSKNVRFPNNEGSYVRFPSDFAYRNIQPPRQWWFPPQNNWRPSYTNQQFIRYQSHGPEHYQRYYGQQTSNRYADNRYKRHTGKRTVPS